MGAKVAENGSSREQKFTRTFVPGRELATGQGAGWPGSKKAQYPKNYIDTRLTVRELVDDADESLFTNILYNKNQILNQFLSQRRNCPYDLRDWTHDRELIQKKPGLGKEFITIQSNPMRYDGRR